MEKWYDGDGGGASYITQAISVQCPLHCVRLFHFFSFSNENSREEEKYKRVFVKYCEHFILYYKNERSDGGGWRKRTNERLSV